MEKLDIIFEDQYYVAINKPAGLLVHPTKIAAHETKFAVKILKTQLDKKVFPIHRIDRKTSGVLLFGLTSEAAKEIQPEFTERKAKKRYLAIVRGYFPKTTIVDHDLKHETKGIQDAVTEFKLIETTEIDLPFGKHNTSRYSLIEAMPITGRMHQIRKHCNHLRHPIIGDRPHGCNKQNKLFKEKWEMNRAFLHAMQLKFNHPFLKKEISIEAKIDTEFKRALEVLKFKSTVV